MQWPSAPTEADQGFLFKCIQIELLMEWETADADGPPAEDHIPVSRENKGRWLNSDAPCAVVPWLKGNGR